MASRGDEKKGRTTGVRLAHLTWEEAAAAAEEGRLVIVPTGAIEAHGPHLPLDCDTHQVDAIALRLGERVGALVAPPLVYGYSTTFMGYPGTISLSAETYQQVVFEVCASLIRHGFLRILILNGNRPNGTANDVAARRLIDVFGAERDLQVTTVSYWEPAAARIHAIRSSRVGGMGHGCEFETSVQMALRPELVRRGRLEGVRPPLVSWDLVAPADPARTYVTWPTPQSGHPAIFGDPHAASAESGEQFLDLVVEALVEVVRRLEPSYGKRRD